MRCVCGSEWWVERLEIQPAARPATDPRMRTAARALRYRLVCADCATPHDAPSKAKRKRSKTDG